MKKFFSMLLALSLLLGCSYAFAEGMGVQVISGPVTETEPVSLDDFKIGDSATIEGWGIIELTNVEKQEGLGHYGDGKTGVGSYDGHGYYWSGSEADYIVLYVDITNLSTKSHNFLDKVTIKAIYDDKYEYGGWYYQRNYNNGTANYSDIDVDKNRQNIRWAVSEKFAIDPMYQGHYLLGVTLPNAVIEGKEPLSIVITIDDNEITYNYRK